MLPQHIFSTSRGIESNTAFDPYSGVYHSLTFSLFSITSSDATCFSRLIVSTVRIFSIRLRSEDAESPVVELIAVDGMAVWRADARGTEYFEG